MKKKIWKILGGIVGIAAVACVIPACVVSCGSSGSTVSQPASQTTTTSSNDVNTKSTSSNRTTTSSTKTNGTTTSTQPSPKQTKVTSTPVNSSQTSNSPQSTSPSNSTSIKNQTTTSSSSITSDNSSKTSSNKTINPNSQSSSSTSSTNSSSPVSSTNNNDQNPNVNNSSSSKQTNNQEPISSKSTTSTPNKDSINSKNANQGNSSKNSQSNPASTNNSKPTSTSSSNSSSSSSSSSKTNHVNPTPTPVTPTMIVNLGTDSLNLQNLVLQLKINNIATFYNNWYEGQYVTDLIPYLTNNNPNITISNLITNISTSKAKDAWGDITGFMISNNSDDIINLETANNMFITTLAPGNSTNVNLSSNMLISMSLPTNAFANSSVTWVMGNLINDKANTIAYGPARAFWSQSRYGGYGYLFSFFGIDNYQNYHYGFKYGEKNVYTMDSSKWYTYQWGLPDGYILMSWVAQILGWNESNQNVLTAYKLYIPQAKQNGSVVINEVKFNNTWYDTNITIECGNGFLLW